MEPREPAASATGSRSITPGGERVLQWLGWTVACWQRSLVGFVGLDGRRLREGRRCRSHHVGSICGATLTKWLSRLGQSVEVANARDCQTRQPRAANVSERPWWCGGRGGAGRVGRGWGGIGARNTRKIAQRAHAAPDATPEERGEIRVTT